MKDLAWQMFKKTGNIEYFLQYKNLEKGKSDFSTEAASDTVLDGEKWRMSKPGEWSSGK
ncbi:MAG: YqzL family protein [Clostridiaceae bacterium]|nr:YqzL family protein [Clostridiaceae bacterium]